MKIAAKVDVRRDHPMYSEPRVLLVTVRVEANRGEPVVGGLEKTFAGIVSVVKAHRS